MSYKLHRAIDVGLEASVKIVAAIGRVICCCQCEENTSFFKRLISLHFCFVWKTCVHCFLNLSKALTANMRTFSMHCVWFPRELRDVIPVAHSHGCSFCEQR